MTDYTGDQGDENNEPLAAKYVQYVVEGEKDYICQFLVDEQLIETAEQVKERNCIESLNTKLAGEIDCKHECVRCDTFGTCSACGERTYSPSGFHLEPDQKLRANYINRQIKASE